MKELVGSAELEAAAIESILEHRRLLDLAEQAYTAMTQGPSDAAVLQRRETYEHAMLSCMAQMASVTTLVDLLGYIPNVPQAT